MQVSRVSVKDWQELRQLQELPQPIHWLYHSGDLSSNLAKPCLAVVGSRKATPYGVAVTTQLVTSLVQADICIVSGLAIGIDSVVHHATLRASGNTIAVLPSSIDAIYPARHAQLAQKIVENGGALVSEYPAGQGTPQKYQFIARNRIIAALAKGVVITEAAIKSGSLHTAQFALEMGREVFVVPGDITRASSAGANNLIKQGAHLVTKARDILEILGISTSSQQSLFAGSLAQQKIIHSLQTKPQTHQDLMSTTKLPIHQLQQLLSELEIQGVIRQSGQVWFLV